MNDETRIKEIGAQLKRAQDYLAVSNIEKGIGELATANEAVGDWGAEAKDPAVKKLLAELLRKVDAALQAYTYWEFSIEDAEQGKPISTGNTPESLHESAVAELENCRKYLQTISAALTKERQ